MESPKQFSLTEDDIIVERTGSSLSSLDSQSQDKLKILSEIPSVDGPRPKCDGND